MHHKLEFEYIEKPFKIQELPLQKVYVLDNWLSTSLHHYFDKYIVNAGIWSKTNQVNSLHKSGLPHHSFWGASFFRGTDYETEYGQNPEHSFFVGYLIRRLQTEFGFKYTRFQYAGLNSQTMGCHGTTHSDCQDDDDWNLSFLYYPNRYWNSEWGGKLRFYDEAQWGLEGRNEHIEEHQIGELEFVPNRLVMFDGRIPHGADAPNENAKYMDRRSLVIRGDECRLILDEREYKNANDRIHLF